MRFVANFFTVLFIISIFFAISCCGSEDKSWEKAKTQNSITGYKKFIEKYPDGTYAYKAQENIEELDFKNAESQNTAQAYQDYLHKYSVGKYSDKAQLNIEKIYFDKAEKEDSIQAYNEFIDLFPESSLSGEVNLKIEKLLNFRHPALKNATTAKIILNESFPKSESILHYFVSDFLPKLLTYAGFEIINSEDRADILLTFNIEGKALSAIYQNKGKQYSGAEVKGNITLAHNGNILHKKNVNYRRSTPYLMNRTYDSPSEAPFSDALSDDIKPKLLEILVESFGTNILKCYISEESDNFTDHFWGDMEPALKILATKWAEEDPWAIDYMNEVIANISVFGGKRRLAYVKFLESFCDSILISSSGNDRKLDFLIQNMKYGDGVIRAIGRLGDTKAVEPLIDYFSSFKVNKVRSDRIVNPVVYALGNLGDTKAVKPLIEYLFYINENHVSSDSKIESLTEALDKLTGKGFGSDLLKWELWWKNNRDKYTNGTTTE